MSLTAGALFHMTAKQKSVATTAVLAIAALVSLLLAAAKRRKCTNAANSRPTLSASDLRLPFSKSATKSVELVGASNVAMLHVTSAVTDITFSPTDPWQITLFFEGRVNVDGEPSSGAWLGSIEATAICEDAAGNALTADFIELDNYTPEEPSTVVARTATMTMLPGPQANSRCEVVTGIKTCTNRQVAKHKDCGFAQMPRKSWQQLLLPRYNQNRKPT